MTARFNPELGKNFPFLNRELLRSLVLAADKACIQKIAIVGGVLRDELINNVHNESVNDFKDLDLVIEGSPIKLLKEIIKEFGNPRITIIRESTLFETVELKIDNLAIDIARARKEKYPKPAENPRIIPTSIEEDLARRDFTINAMALDLRNFELIDPYQGYKAISNRKLEFIHAESATEDPTRIFRAARYSARLNFALEEEAILQIHSAIASWPWEWTISNTTEPAPPALGTRLRMELEGLLEEEQWAKGITTLQEWGALLLLDKTLQNDQLWGRRLVWASRIGVNSLTALIAGGSNPALLAKRLQLPKGEQKLLIESDQIVKHLDSLDSLEKTKDWGAYQWSKEIESYKWKKEAIAIAISQGIACWRPLLRWWGEWRLIKSRISAKDLLENGWRPGPKLGQELNRLRDIELKQYEDKKSFFNTSK